MDEGIDGRSKAGWMVSGWTDGWMNAMMDKWMEINIVLTSEIEKFKLAVE